MKKSQRQRVLILGASGDIGKAVALELAQQGVDLILVGRSCEKLERIAALCESYGSHCLIVPATLTTLLQLDELAVHLALQYKALDGLISCIGYVGSLGPIHQVSEAEWMSTWMINVNLNWKALQSFTALLSKGSPGRALFPLEAYWLEEHAYASVYGLSKKALAAMINQFNLDNALGSVQAETIPLPFANTKMIDKTFPGLQGSFAEPATLAKRIAARFQALTL